MKQEFKVGDKVYYPSKSTKVHALHEKGKEGYALFFNHNNHVYSFKSNGIEWSGEIVPAIFHATPENRELLCKLYGVEFEAPPKPKTPKEVIQAMLDNGWDSVPCYISDDDEATAIRNGIKSLIDMGSIDSWDFCVPFCNRTGKVIIDFVDGKEITE